MGIVSYAQNFEDVMLWRALKDVKNGFYIDIGANDPTEHSVTKAFYENGWSGLNLEPVAHWFNKLEAERPRDANLQIAVGRSNEKLEFFEVVGTGLSTLNKEIAQEHAEKLGFEVKNYLVESKTLTEIYIEKKIDTVHFLKIDVEGAEKIVLQGIDFDIVRPWIIIIEATKPMSKEVNYQGWEELIVSNQYHFVYFDGLNRFYIADEHFELDNYFIVPPNVFDGFELIAIVEANRKVSEAEAKVSEAEAKVSEAEAKVSEAEAKVSEAEDRTNDALHHYHKVLNSNSWKLTKPYRYIGSKLKIFKLWDIFEPSNKFMQFILPTIYLYMKKHKKTKTLIYKIVPKSYKQKLYYSKYKNTGFITFYYSNTAIYFNTVALEDNRGIGRVTQEQLNYLNKNIPLYTKQKINKQIYFYSSIHWCPDKLENNTFIMIHDVTPLVLPDLFPEISQIWNTKFKLIAKQAKKIITISNNSKKDIHNYLDISLEDIIVIPNGVTPLKISNNVVDSLPKKYFVYIGAHDKHKNLSILFQALQEDICMDYHLVLIGNNQSCRDDVIELKLENRVHFLGFIEDKYIGSIVRQSIALLFPSLYEGFGLPPMEAALLKTPSICSLRPTMTEFLSGVTLFADPLNHKDWAKKMYEIDTNKNLRNNLISKSHKRISSMRWENSCNLLLKALTN